MINAFQDVTRKPLPVKEGVAGTPYLDNLLALQIGHGSTTMKGNRNGLWLGAKNYADAPFYVDMNGNVTATSIDLGADYIETGGAAADINAALTQIQGAKIVSLSITSTQIANDSISTPKLQANAVEANNIATNAITAGKISANAVTSDKIIANAVTAGKISVSQLSAISADLGAITAGTITGVTITSQAGASTRIVLDSGNFLRFYGGGAERARLRGATGSGATGVHTEIGNFSTSRENGFLAASNAGNTDFFKFFCNSSGQGVIHLPSSNILIVLSSDGLTNELTYSTANGFFSNRQALINSTLRCKEMKLDYGQNEGNIKNIDTLEGYNDLKLKTNGSKIIIQGGNLDMNEYTIDACQTIWAFNFNNRSDRRLKQKIKLIDSGLETLIKLKPYTYEFKRDKGRERMGLIAQDVEKVLPNL